MFEKATRYKVRFESSKGLLSVEQLWDIPLTSNTGFDLDTIAKGVKREVDASNEESFVVKTTRNTLADLKLELIKHIINVKLAEADAKVSEIQRQDMKRKLQDALARKEDEALSSMSVEDIKKQLANL